MVVASEVASVATVDPEVTAAIVVDVTSVVTAATVAASVVVADVVVVT